MQQRVFCYGTLMLPRLMAKIIGRRAAATPARLEHHRAARLRGHPYPGLWPQQDTHTAGLLYKLHHRHELAMLDRYEGSGYRRCRVRVFSAQGRHWAWVYLPLGRRYQSTGQSWSATHFERHTLPRYLRKIAAWRQIAADGERNA